MNKFSKLNESLEKEVLGWSAKDILNILNKLDCKVNYLYTHFIFSVTDGHEICTIKDIYNGEIKSSFSTFEIPNDAEFHIDHTFSLSYGSLINMDYMFYFKDNKEFCANESIPFDIFYKIYKDINDSISELRNDFYFHIYYNSGKIDLQNFQISLELKSKDSFEKDYLLSIKY